MDFLKTPVVAERLGIGYHLLFGLIRSRRLTPPAKDSSGDYVWTPADVARAREVLTGRGQRRRSSQPDRGDWPGLGLRQARRCGTSPGSRGVDREATESCSEPEPGERM
jgi:hypothetical protein